jgi:HEAT repeat protein
VALAIAAPPAFAQTTGNVDALEADLLGADPDRASAAASSLGALGDRRATEALAGALELGLPPRVAAASLEALGQKKDAGLLDLFFRYARHRRPELRKVALDALGALPQPTVAAVLVDALGDTDGTVRAKAARILGERRERTAEDPLFRLLVRGDEAAGEPLGAVAGIGTVRKLIELVGQVPDRALALALGGCILRPDFGPEPLRVDAVKTLGKLPGSEPVAMLEEYDKKLPEADARPSRAEARRILEGRKAR